MAFKPYKPSPHSKGAEKAEERAWMTRKSVAKPTVKAVRDESRKDKAAFVASKVTGKPGESMMARDEAARTRKYTSPAPVRTQDKSGDQIVRGILDTVTAKGARGIGKRLFR